MMYMGMDRDMKVDASVGVKERIDQSRVASGTETEPWSDAGKQY